MLPGMEIDGVRAPDRQAGPPQQRMRQRIERLPFRWRRTAGLALACYAIVIVFGVTYGIVRAVAHGSTNGPAAIWGICVAGPLALAFVWDRLSGVKVLGVEVTLARAFVQLDSTLATALSASEQQYFSGNEAIFELIDKVIADPDLELLEINLRATRYWWSTRLFLQAALAEDYTNIQRLVFVDGDKERRYVGMASPGQVRRALAQLGGVDLELEYHAARLDAARPGQSQAQRIVESWTAGPFVKEGQPVGEQNAMTPMSAELLVQLIVPETHYVEWNQPLDSPRFQALVLEKDARYIPLTQAGRLAQVVNTDTFARDMATRTLRARIA
jgi:hypothetical protein